MEQWFVFDMRGQFLNYEAAFACEAHAREWATAKLGEHALVTRDFRNTLVAPKALSKSRR